MKTFFNLKPFHDHEKIYPKPHVFPVCVACFLVGCEDDFLSEGSKFHDDVSLTSENSPVVPSSSIPKIPAPWSPEKEAEWIENFRKKFSGAKMNNGTCDCEIEIGNISYGSSQDVNGEISVVSSSQDVCQNGDHYFGIIANANFPFCSPDIDGSQYTPYSTSMPGQPVDNDQDFNCDLVKGEFVQINANATKFDGSLCEPMDRISFVFFDVTVTCADVGGPGQPASISYSSDHTFVFQGSSMNGSAARFALDNDCKPIFLSGMN